MPNGHAGRGRLQRSMRLGARVSSGEATGDFDAKVIDVAGTRAGSDPLIGRSRPIRDPPIEARIRSPVV
ncbi:MAG: hypothetical protein CL933_08540 [Deltaproteobacteria bacterium]|nr:hypothetical protein [Deltaproteobacteria bacterium]